MTVTLILAPETERRLQEKAAQAGLALEAYLQQLAEREAFDGDSAAPAEEAANPSELSFKQMTGPLAQAVEAAGLSEEVVAEFFDDVLKEVRAERRAKQDPSS